MARRSYNISGHTRRIVLALMYIALAGGLIASIAFIGNAIPPNSLFISMGSGATNTTALSFSVPNNQSYILNFTATPSPLPYNLLIGNLSTLYNITVVNQSYQYCYVSLDGIDVGTYSLTPYVVNITINFTDGGAGTGAYFFLNFTTAKGTLISFMYIVDGSVIDVYVNNTAVVTGISVSSPWLIMLQDNTTNINIYIDNNFITTVDDSNLTELYYDDEAAQYENGGYWRMIGARYTYLLNGTTVLSLSTLQNITYNGTYILAGSTALAYLPKATSINAPQPITIYYYLWAGIDLTIIVYVAEVLFAVLLFYKAAKLMGVAL